MAAIPPPFLLLKLCTVQPDATPALGLFDAVAELPRTIYILNVTVEYSPLMASLKEFQSFVVDLHGIPKDCVVVSVGPAPDGATPGVEVHLLTSPVVPPAPALGPVPVTFQSLELGARLHLGLGDLKTAFPEFVFCSVN